MYVCTYGYILEPAPDLIPATEAVAMIEPPEAGFSAEVFCMALLAYLMARKTLHCPLDQLMSLSRSQCHLYAPQHINLQNMFKLAIRSIPHNRSGSMNTGVCIKHIQAAVLAQRLVHHLLHRLLVRSVKLPCMHIYAGVKLLQLGLQRWEVVGDKVANVEGLQAIVRILVGCRAANADDGIAAWRPRLSPELTMCGIEATYR
jgi:hypothetical protein